MKELTQQAYPRLWDAFQFTIGASCAKGRLLTSLVPKAPCSVLEIGCSTGNLARVFTQRPEVAYTGLDIDPGAIALARRKYSGTDNLSFCSSSLEAFTKETDRTFDIIVYAGVLHHNSDQENSEMLRLGGKLSENDSSLVVIEPVWPRKEDGRTAQWFLRKFEKGTNVKTESGFKAFLDDCRGIKIAEWASTLISITPFSGPRLVRMMTARGRWTNS